MKDEWKFTSTGILGVGVEVAGSGVEREAFALPLSQREAGKTRHRERLNIVTAVGLRLETYIPQGALQARHEAEATYKEHMIRFAFPKDLPLRQRVEWLNTVKAIGMTR